jgi:hypothetical protein
MSFPVGDAMIRPKPLRGYKAQLLEGGIRVPFLMQWKGQLPAGKVDNRPIIALDVLPTVLAAAGVSIPAEAKLDGVNLLPYLTGKDTSKPHDALFWRYSSQSAVRSGDWKLIRAGKQVRLYNIANGLGEKSTCRLKNPRRSRNLRRLTRHGTRRSPSCGRKNVALRTTSLVTAASRHNKSRAICVPGLMNSTDEERLRHESELKLTFTGYYWRPVLHGVVSKGQCPGRQTRNIRAAQYTFDRRR